MKRNVWALQDARDILKRLVGDSMDWVPMDAYLAQYLAVPAERATVLASSFASSLELARQGHLELRQSTVFGPLFMRRRRDGGGTEPQ
jgi:segregation and condensation protein A